MLPFALSRGGAKSKTRIGGSFDTPLRQAQWLLRMNGDVFYPAATASRCPCGCAIIGASPSLESSALSLSSPALAAVSSLRSEEHTSELQSLMRISYAVFCLKKKKTILKNYTHTQTQT